jgi:hypothetical protein
LFGLLSRWLLKLGKINKRAMAVNNISNQKHRK